MQLHPCTTCIHKVLCFLLSALSALSALSDLSALSAQATPSQYSHCLALNIFKLPILFDFTIEFYDFNVVDGVINAHVRNVILVLFMFRETMLVDLSERLQKPSNI